MNVWLMQVEARVIRLFEVVSVFCRWLFLVGSIAYSFFFSTSVPATMVDQPAVLIELGNPCTDLGNAWVWSSNSNATLETGLGADTHVASCSQTRTATITQVNETMPFDDSYVPHKGAYSVVPIFCPHVSTCDLDRGSQLGAPVGYDNMTTSTPWTKQKTPASRWSYVFTGIITEGSYCYAMVDSQGNYYHINGTITCGGGIPTPPTPPPAITCKFADGNSVIVNMGQLDRNTLPTTPNTGTKVSKSVDVTCEGDGTLSTVLKIQYTPLAIKGTDTAKTSTDGLGVTVLLDDKVMANNDTVAETFSVGSNMLNFNFEAVRDPLVSVGDIKTGAFSSSVVVVVTPQ